MKNNQQAQHQNNCFLQIILFFSSLLVSGSLLALDTDGDGFPDVVNGSISAGSNHTCALDDNGVHCWGDNTYRQTSVPSLVNPVSVSAGGFHTCAVDATGVKCWGSNGYGQTTVPSTVNPMTDISSGEQNVCAIVNNTLKGVICWGGEF